MAICPQCRREVPDNAILCPYCGAQLNPDYVVCGNCGRLIPADAKICPYCGAELSDTVRCPNCGHEIPADSKSCPYCGFRFDKDHPLVRIEYKESKKGISKSFPSQVRSTKDMNSNERKITYTIRPNITFTPRSYWGMFTFLFLYFGLAMGLVYTFIFSYPHLENFGTVFWNIGFWIFLLSGVLFATPMAYLLRNITTIVNYPPEGAFINQVNTAMAQIGYYPISDVSDTITYKPSLANGLAAGKMILQKDNQRVVITGAYHFLKKLIKILGWEPA